MALQTLIDELLSVLCVKCLIQYARPISTNASSSGSAEASEESSSFEGQLHPKRKDCQVPTTDPDALDWHRFLDYLCALCQFEHAGDSVVALAVQRSRRAIRFVLAVNHNVVEEPADHLQFILNSLQELSQAGPRTAQEIIDEIRERSIQRAADRVCEYRKKLNTFLKEAEAETNPLDQDEQFVLVVLQALVSDCNNSELCSRLTSFCTGQEYRTLSKVLCLRSRAYRRIRHAIGRLTLWERAASSIAASAPRYIGILNSASVTYVECKPDVSGSQEWPSIGRLEGLVAAVCPRLATSDILLRATVHSLQSAAALLKKFQLHAQVPVVHAEAALAHHFWLKGWKFASPNTGNEDRYIGCSKPSCYSCSMYLKHHVGNFKPRPAHGRAWLRWHPPVLLGSVVPGQVLEKTEKFRKLEEDENKRILNLMTEEMQQDVESCIFNQRYGIRADFDSTTGMSGRTGEAMQDTRQRMI